VSVNENEDSYVLICTLERNAELHGKI
jgi:hypothetical protein